jgi:guanosine-3',5'-bis(diphosphate) 3'-pyrophosphohydrolase
LRTYASNLGMSADRLTGRSSGRVKLADKICNLRDIVGSPPKGWSIERNRQYFDWAKKVIDKVRDTNLKLERRFDQLYRTRP